MKAIGIDLGTTNSVAAYCDPGSQEPKVLPNSSGENLTPSVVSLRKSKTGENEILVGRSALNYAMRSPENTIVSIKRLMGRDYADPHIQKVIQNFNYQVVPGTDGDPRAHVRLGDDDYTPAEISAMILRQIRQDTSRVLGEPVTHAVITVPAYFNEGQRVATREAGEQAGLVVKKIIDEPTAAAIAFGIEARPGDRHRILVFDLGGGTFDISILQMVKDHRGKGQFQIMQTEGSQWLGGDDFDAHILDKIIAAVRDETGEDPTHDKRFLLLARQQAEGAKRALGQVGETDLVIPAAYRTAQGLFIDVELSLSREEFAAMIRGDVERSLGIVQKAMGKENLTPESISDILLVGGATFTPAVYEAVQGLFGAARVRSNVHPMECVSLGASVLATTMRGVECPNQSCRLVNEDNVQECEKCGSELMSGQAVGDLGILEVTAMSLGVAAVKDAQRDIFVPIIPKGTPYPLREPMKKRFSATDERLIRVPVYEGDEPVASRNAEQGVIEYELPQEVELDTEVEVSLNYDRHRQLTVTIRVPGTELYKLETLRHDLPRSPRPLDTSEQEAEETWQDQLADTIDFSSRFLQRYQPYIETSQAMKLQRDIDRAKQLLVYPDEVEGNRMYQLLNMDIFNCGLATQLMLADRATQGAPPEEAQQINDAARIVRECYEQGEREQAAEKERLLKVLVAKRLDRHAGIQQVTDLEDYGGLLRLLGE